jgi:hypothetical protein
MLKTAIITLALLFSAVPAFAEEEPTMHQVYLAAEAGKFNEAQAMMDKVLHDHPNSAKAHFVEAELLAKQGLFSKADAELSTAERLQPGLPFTKPEAVKDLKNRIASASGKATPANTGANTVAPSLPAAAKDWTPWILLILGIGLVVLFINYMSRRNSNMIPGNNYHGNVPGSNMSSAGANGAGPVMGQPAAGGMGSGIMGNLATGAALGAGVVAGEALMHHFIDGDKKNVIPEPPQQDTSPWSTPTPIADNDNDMGGTDFGIADDSSWDDDVASDGGDDDWT